MSKGQIQKIGKAINFMKKFFFSSIVFVTFAGYVLYVRHSTASLVDAITPPGLLNVQSAPTLTNVSSGSSPPPKQTPAPVASTTQPKPKSVSDPTPKPVPAPKPIPAPTPQGQYKNGVYTGNLADAYYGNIQVRVTISGGAIIHVAFLQYPSDRNTSVRINMQAMPHLQQEAIAAQNSKVNIVSGATDSSQAFRQSLAYALAQAKN